MSESTINRELLGGGAVLLTAPGCSFEFRRPEPGKLHVIVKGHDRGMFGTSTLDELSAAVARDGKIAIFVDAREVTGVAVGVSEEWRRFFERNRENLSRVHVLVGSRVFELTVAIVRHLSNTGNLIRIYSDPEQFAAQMN